jgi:hypothetical protein
MVTSRSVPQQMEQMLSARAGHSRFTLRLLQIGHTKFFSLISEPKIMPHFGGGYKNGSRQVVPRMQNALTAEPPFRAAHCPYAHL